MGIAEFKEEIKKVVDDLITLDVITLTGKAPVDFAKLSDPKKGISDLCSALAANFATNATNPPDKKVEFVAMTHLELDADAMMYVKEAPNENDKALITAHNEAVKAAMEARRGMLETVVRLLGISW